jgi:hypothetical protein
MQDLIDLPPMAADEFAESSSGSPKPSRGIVPACKNRRRDCSGVGRDWFQSLVTGMGHSPQFSAELAAFCVIPLG